MTQTPELIERASALDLMALASGTTPAAGQIGVVLVLDGERAVDLDEVRSALAERIVAVPRLRQVLRRAPFGCGRPIWVDRPGFEIGDHVHEVVCPAPGDRGSLVRVAAGHLVRPLQPDLPLWSATLVSGLADGTVALVIVFHHVLADGIGGLAILGHLVDGTPPAVGVAFPRPAPTSGALALDAARGRLRAVLRAADGLRALRDTARDLRAVRHLRAPACSLNQPVGDERCIAVARTELGPFHAMARANGATLNDAAMAAIAGALGRYLADAGERLDHLVMSIPVAGRGASGAGQLGNQIGIMPLSVPTVGSPSRRIAEVAESRRSAHRPSPGASIVLADVFRLLATARLLGPLTRRQRMVNTFVTNLRGPSERLSFLGVPVQELIPLNSTSGNVGVAFGVFSYSGSLSVTVVADGRLSSRISSLTDELQRELDLAAGAA